MSFYQLPCWVVQRIDNIHRNFLWRGNREGSKGFNLINWKCVRKKKEFDDLGVLNLKDMNKALMCKWWWKLYSHSSAKWKSFIQVCRRRKRVRFEGNLKSRKVSPFWKGISKTGEFFHALTSCILGNGQNVNFWKDRRCSGTPVQYRFPNLFDAAENKFAVLANSSTTDIAALVLKCLTGNRQLLSFNNFVGLWLTQGVYISRAGL